MGGFASMLLYLMAVLKVFEIIDLYNLIKPVDSPNIVTSYPVIFGGTTLNLNQVKGGFIITQISSKPIGSPVIKVDKNDTFYQKIQKSLIENTYQVDFYKKYDNDDKGKMIPYDECSNLMEFFKSYECLEYLKNFNCEILPNYSSINLTSEFTELKELINRATFDFTIVTASVKIFDTMLLDKIEFDKGIIV